MYNFNYDKSSGFRLRIENEQYHVNAQKRTVTIVADVHVEVPEYVTRTIQDSQLPNGFYNSENWYVANTPIRMKHVARCSDEDVFDEAKGKKIAMAALETKAYRSMSKRLRTWGERFFTGSDKSFIVVLNKMGAEFLDKAEKAAEHDERYINEITKQ